MDSLQSSLDLLAGVALGVGIVLAFTCAIVTASALELARLARKWTKAYLDD